MSKTDSPSSHEPAQPSELDVARISLSHPKNYFGVPLAVSATGDTGGLISLHLVDMAGKPRAGAEELCLIDDKGDLTHRGKRIVMQGRVVHGSSEAALEAFAELSGQPKQFVSLLPEWTRVSQQLFASQEPMATILTLLDELGGCTLVDLVGHLHETHPDVADIFWREGSPFENTSKSASDVSCYRGAAVCQLKGLLYHAGFLTERGADTSHLRPESDRWELADKMEVDI